MVTDWLNNEHIDKERIQAYNTAFTTNTPFAHIAIDQFLQSDKLQQLIDGLQEEQFINKTADLFSFKQTNDLQSAQTKTLQEARAFFASDAFLSYMEQLTGLHFKRGQLDLAATLYQNTDFLLCHDDQLDTRTLAFLLYLTDMNEEDGGSLDLFAEENGVPTKITQRIVPKANRFACFAVSKKSFHEVAEVLVDKDRAALGGWLHGQ